MYLNQMTLIGNLGADPEVIKSDDKSSFVRMSVLTKIRYIDSHGVTVERKEWHAVYANNHLGKYAAQWFKKGAKVLIQGELRSSEYKDKEGIMRKQFAVYANLCQYFQPKKPEANATEAAAESESAVPETEIEGF